MSAPRDTQFKNFAKALLDEMMGISGGNVWIEHCSETSAEEQWREMIARRAYDLVQHTLTIVPHLMQVAENAQTVDEVIVYVPDLAELPEVSQ